MKTVKTILYCIAWFGGFGLGLELLSSSGILPTILMGPWTASDYLNLLWSVPLVIFVMSAIPYSLFKLVDFILPDTEEDDD